MLIICRDLTFRISSRPIAAALLTGIITDTLGFRTSNTTSESLRQAALLDDCVVFTRELGLLEPLSDRHIPPWAIAIQGPNYRESLVADGLLSRNRAVLWLLPWALVDGPASGAVAGLALGLVLDSLHWGGATQVPVLLFLGWWWGRIGRRGAPIERSFNLGLLALLGSALLGASLLLQLHGLGDLPLPQAGLLTLAAQSLITALLAPLVCSLLLLRWRQAASLRG